MDKVLRIRRFQVRPEEVLIIANGVKKESMPLSREIEDYLYEHQIRHSTIMTMSTSDDISIPYSTDFVISLGGDGTVLYVARKVHELGLPILPVNLGTFGYITEVGKNEWREAFERYLNVGDNLSRRLMLKVSVTRKKKKIFSSYALNEATVSSSGTSKVVKLELDLDNTYSGLFKADGIIVATPTGSTGYSLAAGGPILMSDISAFIITPICPFTLSNRPLVTGSETNCTIKVAEGQRTGVVLSVDGQVSIDLEEGDEVNIEKSRSKALLILSHKRNYIEVIRDKLNWSGEMHA